MARDSLPDWCDRPMRWAQLTFTENDPEDADLDFWFDYFRRIHADGVVLSTGGYIAYHPSRIPLQYRSNRLGDDDFFGDAVQRARAQGMVVIVRTDPHAVHQDVYDAHPDWIAVTAEGAPRRHWSTPDTWVTCALGPYNFEQMTRVNVEIMEMYRVEALFGNRWAGSGMCYCEHCRRNFFDVSGHALPRAVNPRDPAYRAYLIWRQARLFDLWELWDSTLRAVNPQAHYITNSGGGAMSNLNMKTVGEHARILFADRQARRGVMAPWAVGKNGKEYRAAMGDKPVGEIFSVGPEESHRWKDSVQSDAELRIWVADSIANGMRPWFTKFAGVVHDDRWMPVVEDIYRRHHRHQAYLRNTASLAQVGLVYSQQTAAYYGGAHAQEKVEDPALGYYQALIEARIPFEMVHDELLEPARIGRFKTLILPNIAALSERQCDQLREFVARGGSLVATYESSLYDEWGEKRGDFGLADLLGVTTEGVIEGPMKNAYLHLNHEDGPHAVLAGLETARRAIHGVHRLEVRPTAAFPKKPVTLVPAYPDLPMEEVYPRVPRTDIPELYLREIGASRIAYFPWDIARTFWEVLNEDHAKLLANAVTWATAAPPPVTVNGPGTLDVTIWRQAASMTVHLVNLTNPMMMRGAFRELIPMGPYQVSVALPEGARSRGVRLLHSDSAPPFEVIDGRLHLTVETVLDHEIIAVDLA